jgi:hypothetical protein
MSMSIVSLGQNLQRITKSLIDILMFTRFSYFPSEKQCQERNDPVSDINIRLQVSRCLPQSYETAWRN